MPPKNTKSTATIHPPTELAVPALPRKKKRVRATAANLEDGDGVELNAPTKRQCFRVTGDARPPRRKTAKDAGGEDLSKATLAVLRKKLRDTQRLLKRRDKLTAVKTQDAERRLKAVESEIMDRELQVKKNSLSQKYKYIKFVERKRTARRIKAAVKAVVAADSPAARALAQRILDDLKLNYNYIMHYPPLRKYIALYPATDEDGSRDEREAMRADILAKLESGEIEDAWESATRENPGGGEEEGSCMDM